MAIFRDPVCPVKRLALWQCAPSVVSDKKRCIDVIRDTCALAKNRSADLVVFPEMFLTGYGIGPDMTRAQAEHRDGQSAQEILKLSNIYNIIIVYGYPEIDENGNVYNSVNIVAPEMDEINCYRKRMLFGEVDRSQFSPGGRPGVIYDIDGVNYGIAICYDIEFPEIARDLAMAGAEVILVPTANMTPYEYVADRLIPARALENGVFVAYANYSGEDDLFKYFGKSVVCDPLGEVVVQAEGVEQMVFADLDLNKVRSARNLNNYLFDCHALRHPRV